MSSVAQAQRRALARKVMAGFEAAAVRQRELASREVRSPGWAVEVSVGLFEVARPKLHGEQYRDSRARQEEPVRALYREALRRAARKSERSLMSLMFSSPSVDRQRSSRGSARTRTR
jgi:hypothetical protein